MCHLQRAPDKQPPAVVSVAFTILALAPLAGLIVTLGALGVSFQVMQWLHMHEWQLHGLSMHQEVKPSDMTFC